MTRTTPNLHRYSIAHTRMCRRKGSFIYRMRLFVSALLPFLGVCTGPSLSMVAYTFSQRKFIILSLIIQRSSLSVLSANTKTANGINLGKRKIHLIERRCKAWKTEERDVKWREEKKRKKKKQNKQMRVREFEVKGNRFARSDSRSDTVKV